MDLINKLDVQISSLMPDRKRLKCLPVSHLRQMLRLSVEEMAEKLDCTPVTVRKYERGSKPCKHSLMKITSLARRNNYTITREELFKL